MNVFQMKMNKEFSVRLVRIHRVKLAQDRPLSVSTQTASIIQLVRMEYTHTVLKGRPA